MRNILRAGLCASALALCMPAIGAPRIVAASTVSGLSWNVAGLSGTWFASTCNSLDLDLTGDINGGKFAVYGTLNCGTGSYSVSGSGYVDVTNSLTLTQNIGSLTVFTCVISLVNLSGTCTGNLISTGQLKESWRLTPKT